MNIGNDCFISDNYFPIGKITKLKDSNGNILVVGDKVEIRGCSAKFGYIGFHKKPILFFATKKSMSDEYEINQWFLDKVNAKRLTKVL